MRTITVVGRDNRAVIFEGVVMYTVTVRTLDHETVLEAFSKVRESDIVWLESLEKLDVDTPEIEILFCFDGKLNAIADWRI
jgi:hypothetical protein